MSVYPKIISNMSDEELIAHCEGSDDPMVMELLSRLQIFIDEIETGVLIVTESGIL